MPRIGNKLLPLAPLAGAIVLALPAKPVDARVIYAIMPSLTVAAVHDDNIFLTQEPTVSDRIVRYTPGIAVDYTVDALNILASYSQDAEYYEDNSQFDSNSLRRTGIFQLTHDFSQRLRWGLNASYFKTPTPGELNLGDGLIQLGRVTTTRTTAGGTLDYAVSPTVDSSFAYTLSRDETEIGIDGDTHEARAEASKALSARNAVLFGYTYRLFEYNDGTEQDTHTALIGWEHQLSPRTMFTVMAGPRWVGNSIEPAVDLSLVHEFLTGDVTLTYLRSEGLLAGSSSRIETELAGVVYNQRIGQKFTFSLGPAIGETDSELGAVVKVRYLVAEARYTFNDYFYVNASFQRSRQSEHITGGFRRDVPRDVALVALNFTWPIRRERP